MNRRAVILDVDAGVDDAWAILLALTSPELDVLAITTVSGNVHVDQCTKNVLRVLSLLPAHKMPVVARGEEKPLRKELNTATSVHGEDGLGDLGDDYYPSLNRELVTAKPAVELLPELVAGMPGQVTIVATGPITNVAKAIETAPDAMSRTREVVVMGGAIHEPGNVPPLDVAEFNTYVDPDALRTVLEFGVPVTLVPLDVTQKVRLMRNHAKEALAGCSGVVPRFIYGCAQKYMDFHRRTDGLDGAYMHDPLAVGLVIDFSLVKTDPYRIYVETREGLTQGMTVPYRHPGKAEELPNCRAGVSVEAERFLRMFLERIHALTA